MDIDLVPLERRPDLFATSEPFAALDFELRLAMADTRRLSFERCIRDAAQAVGGTLLFEMPDQMIATDVGRVAAVALPGQTRDVLVFVGLDERSRKMRVMGREEVGERFHDYASAYLATLGRLSTQFETVTRQPRVRVLGAEAVRSARS